MKFSYDGSLLSPSEIETTAATMAEYTKHLTEILSKKTYDYPESSILLPSDSESITRATSLAKELKSPKLKYIIDIGIGGSNLGTKAIYDAFFGFFDVVEPGRSPKMFFGDTNNPVFLSKLCAFLKKNVKSPEEVVVNIISKSGSTTETIVNTEVVLSALQEVIPDINTRVVITSEDGSKFAASASEKGYKTLFMPKTVGGRYSVFSVVGLFPLALAGVDIEAFCEGGISGRSHTSALHSAVVLYLQMKKGKTINDNFFFHGELESLGKWYRQLMGESIGKDGKGITPTVSIGSTDLHSVAQLYYGGPHDKMTTFVRAEKTNDLSIPKKLIFDGLVAHINGKKVSDIMMAITEGVKISYKNESMPFMEIVLDDISEKSLGEYMQFKMIEMMYLGKLLGVNTFDQPHVELYKVEMKKVLSSQR